MAKGHVVLFPLPFQGHLSPMLQLADVLHGRGLAITILHTTFNAPDPASHPEFHFVAVPVGMPNGKDGIGKTLAMNAAMEATGCVRDALACVDPRPVCLVIDTSLLAVHKAAAKLGLPTIVLHTGSAAGLRLFRSNAMLHDKGYLPAQEHELDRPVKELAPIRVSDLFDPSKYPDLEMANKILDTAAETTNNSSGIVINTFEALEAPELEAIRDELAASGVRVFAIGPLHKLSTIGSASSSLLEEDTSCIEWLDTQAAGSVLYVSFGSMVPVQRDDFDELAWGLANSGKPFLWVVRRGLVVGSGTEVIELPEGFERATEGRGKVVRWAPQQEVLGHRAVGGFWTHSGWNSTLEGICEGVPMLCRPLFADQPANARYVEEVWRIGALLVGKLERGKIEQAISRFMEGEDAAIMRERAMELQIKAHEALNNDGSTQLAVDKLVDYILSL